MQELLAQHMSPEILAAGVAVEPDLVGKRTVLHVADGETLIEGSESPRSPIDKALVSLRRDLILDGILVGEDVSVFDVIHTGEQSLTAHPWRERQKVLMRLLRKPQGCLRRVEPRTVHTAEALRDAIAWASDQESSRGALLKLVDSIYIPGGFSSSWIAVTPESPTDALPEEMRRLYPRYVDPEQPIVKRGSDEERFTLGIVLEPDVVDAQDDRYTAAEVRKACHRFAEFYWNAGLMHKEIVNGKVVILENYLAPCEFTAENGEKVKAGTWLQGRGYRDDKIWTMVKSGKLTGLSMGGSAIRKPAAKETAQIEAE